MCCPKNWPKNAGIGPACKPCDDGERKLEQVGGDRDAHGCIPSAGYTWCAAKNKCLRPFEEACDAPAPVEAKTEKCGCICPNDVCLAVYACTPSERSAELAGRCPSAAASTLKKEVAKTEKSFLCGCNCPGPNGMNCFAHFQCSKAEYVKEMASCPRKL